MVRIENDEKHKLIDLILSMPNYSFCCHKQILNELSRNTDTKPYEYILNHNITVWDDKDILDALYDLLGDMALLRYAEMLKKACDAFKFRYYDMHFKSVAKANILNLDKTEFLKLIDSIKEGSNHGEIKTYVLKQMLSFINGDTIYIFCSDDRNARNGIISIGDVRCISILSSFLRLQKEIAFTKEEAYPYFKSYIHTCFQEENPLLKVHESSKEMRMIKRSSHVIFEDLFDNKLAELKNGNLRYK